MSKEWFIKEGGQVCFKSDNAELNGWDIQSLVDCLNGKEIKISDLEAKLAESEKKFIVANNLRKNSDEVLLNYKTEKYGLDKTIQELRRIKLSLPEKEWYYKGFENCERQMSSHIADLTLEVKELKQQLAEKDEQIKKLNYIILISQLQAPEEQRLKIIGSSCCQYNPNQDKISFAVEQLEKVKERMKKGYHYGMYNQNLIEYIDNQIKQLKGVK